MSESSLRLPPRALVIPICYPHSVGGCGSSGGTCDATLYNYSIHLRELLELGKEPNQFDASILRGFFLERNRCCGWGGENVHHGTSHVLAVSDR